MFYKQKKTQYFTSNFGNTVFYQKTQYFTNTVFYQKHSMFPYVL